jgi:hypothetical protein
MAPLNPVELAQHQLRAAVVVLLHELSWDASGQRHALRLDCLQRPDGGVEGDLQVTNITTGEMWGSNL